MTLSFPQAVRTVLPILKNDVRDQSDGRTQQNVRTPSKKRPRICLIGATHYVNDERMLFHEAIPLASRYNVEVAGIGESIATTKRNQVRVISFRRSSKATHLKLLLQMFLYLRSRQFDIIHCFDLDALIVAIFAKSFSKRKKQKIIYDAHEHFPSLIADYINVGKTLSAKLESFVDLLESSCASCCAGFVAVNDYLFRKFSVFGKPIVLVRNLPELSWFDLNKSRIRS